MNVLLEQIGPAVVQVGVFVLATATVAFLFAAVRAAISARSERVQRRISAVGVAGPTEAPRSVRPSGTPSMVDAVIKPIASVAKPSDERELEGLRSRLSYAGYRSEFALYNYLLVKVVLCITGAALVLTYNHHQPQAVDRAALYTVLAMFFGFYGPNVWLAGRIKERQTEINHALPDAMDLLVTCVEAGLSVEAGLNRISDEIKLSAPLLAGELAQATLEMRAGLTRGEAFHGLGARTGVPDLKYLASIIVQAEIFGTSVAKSLRVMADSMRTRRTQIAEKNAATASVKMTIPLVLCILPSLFTFLLGPAAINIMRLLLPALGGGGGE